jgi:hypothetical protein
MRNLPRRSGILDPFELARERLRGAIIHRLGLTKGNAINRGFRQWNVVASGAHAAAPFGHTDEARRHRYITAAHRATGIRLAGFRQREPIGSVLNDAEQCFR